MFYNNAQRKKSIGLNEEYAKIVEVVTRYAINYPHIKFSCRKLDDKKTDVSTHNVVRAKDCLPNAMRIEIIKKTYG